MNAPKQFKCPSSWTLEQRLNAGTAAQDANGCMMWQRSCTKTGYGTLGSPSGRVVKAHRAAMSIKLGRELGRHEVARHSCDRPGCVNPDHLSLGTQKDNVDDRTGRGRAVGAAFKSSAMPAVLDMRAAGSTQMDIAAALGVSPTTVSKWLIEQGLRTRRPCAVSLEFVEKRRRCQEMWVGGAYTKSEIARQLGVAPPTISNWTRKGFK